MRGRGTRIITSIEEPENGIWRGAAKLGSRNLTWRYEARGGWLKIQDTSTPQCWNFIQLAFASAPHPVQTIR